MARNVAYTRKSTDTHKYNTIERDLERFKILGFADDDIYFDILSGDDDERPNFNLIWSEIKRGVITSLTITRDDRLGRKASTLLQIYKDIEKSNCRLIILDDYGDTDFNNPYEWERRATAVIRSESERRMLITRIKKGQDFVISQGKSLGGRCPYGYYRNKEKLILIKEELRPQLISIVEIAVKSESYSQTCKIIKERFNLHWREPQLRHWLHCASLRGHIGWSKINENLHHPSDSPNYRRMLYNVTPENRIMSEETYTLIKEQTETNKKVWGATKKANIYPLRGLCKCKYCGVTLAHNNNGKIQLRHPYNVVTNQNRTDECSYVVRAELIENKLIAAIRARKQLVIALLSQDEAHQPNLELIKINNDIQTLESMNNPILDASIKALYKQKELLLNNDKKANKQEIVENYQLCDNDYFWQLLSGGEKLKWFRYFVKEIIVSKEDKKTQFEIIFNH